MFAPSSSESLHQCLKHFFFFSRKDISFLHIQQGRAAGLKTCPSCFEEIETGFQVKQLYEMLLSSRAANLWRKKMTVIGRHSYTFVHFVCKL